MEALASNQCTKCKRRTSIKGQTTIQCDVCKLRFHKRCVQLEEYEAAHIDRYHCPSCLPQAGPSIYKAILNTHRYEYDDPNAADKPMENGTRRFIEELKKRKFMDAGEIVLEMEDGRSLTRDYLDETEFQKPIFVKHATGLGLDVPPASFTVDDIGKSIGEDRVVVVGDSYAQCSYEMRFRTFSNLFKQEERRIIYNIISLEYSDTEMSKLVKSPKIMDEIDWVEKCWPKSVPEDLTSAQKAMIKEHVVDRPEVAKYCLISMAGSFTDFHIDFGGTAFFIHMVWGEKVFYLIEPTGDNLRSYESWKNSPDPYQNFFADMVEKCYQLTVKPGQTLFVPSGWIHAVYTPLDSLMFGGNFLQKYGIEMQMKVNDLESRANYADKFMFPNFELTNWYAAANFLETMKELNEQRTPAKPYLLIGLKSMIAELKRWIERDETRITRLKSSRQLIVAKMTRAEIVQQLEQAVTLNENVAASLIQSQPSESISIILDRMSSTDPANLNITPTSAFGLDGSLISSGYADHNHIADGAASSTISSNFPDVIKGVEFVPDDENGENDLSDAAKRSSSAATDFLEIALHPALHLHLHHALHCTWATSKLGGRIRKAPTSDSEEIRNS